VEHLAGEGEDIGEIHDSDSFDKICDAHGFLKRVIEFAVNFSLTGLLIDSGESDVLEAAKRFQSLVKLERLRMLDAAVLTDD
jgi:hypothetical protein